MSDDVWFILYRMLHNAHCDTEKEMGFHFVIQRIAADCFGKNNKHDPPKEK